MPTQQALLRTPYLRYDGTNAAEILGRYPAGNVGRHHTSPDGTVTITEIYGNTLVIPVGSYVIGPGESVGADAVVDAAYFTANYVPMASVTPPPQVTYTLRTAVGQVALPVLTLAAPNFTATGTWDKTMPASITPADVNWRALAGAVVLSSIRLQDIASPVTVTATGFTLALRTTGGASVAGVVLVDAHKLVQA